MFYFTGIYNYDRAPVSRSDIGRMLGGDKKNNCNTFIRDNFGVAIKLPDKENKYLSVPQIVQSAQKDIVVVFEGYLRNVSELIGYLPDYARKNQHSHSNIICNLYQNGGLKFLSRLKGAFVFILWDKKRDRFILSRDAIGFKSLYYYINDNFLLFGNIVNTILRSPHVNREINFKRIYNYFILNGLSFGDDTEYKHISNVPPGNILILDRNGLGQKQIFNFDIYNLDDLGEQEISDKYYDIIKKSIGHYLSITDKVAVAFSGGVDSNAILALCAKKKNIKIDTFTVNFESQSKKKMLDYKIAKRESAKHGANHHELRLTPELFLNDLTEVIDASGRLINLNYFNDIYIHKWIARFNNFVFTGDGIEEQLGSYRYTWFSYYADEYLKKSCGIDIYSLNNLLYGMFYHRTGSYSDNIKKAKLLFNKNVNNMFSEDYALKMRDTCLEKAINTNLIRGKDCFTPSVLNKCFWIDFFHFFCPNKLMTDDLITRNYSIEIAMPFVSDDFVSFSSQIPADLKCKGFEKNETKYIFRHTVSRLIGTKNAFFNFKSGSDIPFNQWLLNPEFEKFIRGVLDPARVKKSGILNEKYVAKIVNRHYRKRELFTKSNSHWLYKKGLDYRSTILKLAGFQLWWENHFA